VESAGPTNFRHGARRGLTFIETVCAVAMLALVSAAVLGAFNSMISQQDRQNHRLGAMELCNRLVLQYLDDSDTMPASGLPIVYGNERYRWELKKVPVRLLPARPEVAEDRASASTVSVDRMQAVTVTVWLSEESGGSQTYEPSAPSATLTRLMDPIAMRNPDTTKYLGQSAAKQRELIETFRTIGRNSAAKPNTSGSTPTPSPASGGTPPSTVPGGTPAPDTGPRPSGPVKPLQKQRATGHPRNMS
jgi:type II secretory pathway pseudopilin PulG